MTYFDEIKRRMPHFFRGVGVLEYGPHDRCKAIEHLFDDCHYIVLSPETNDLSGVQMDSFRVAISIDRFQYTKNYLNEFKALHKVASKFVMFSCAAAGRKRGSQVQNLTEADFSTQLDLDQMFETYRFHVDSDTTTLYFWGVKRLEYN